MLVFRRKQQHITRNKKDVILAKKVG